MSSGPGASCRTLGLESFDVPLDHPLQVTGPTLGGPELALELPGLALVALPCLFGIVELLFEVEADLEQVVSFLA